MRPFLLGLLGGLTAIVIVAVAVAIILRVHTPDRRAALLSDLDDLDRAAQQPLTPFLGGCLTLTRPAPQPSPLPGAAGAQLAAASAYFDQRRYDETQVFLRQHPALDTYATWLDHQGRGLTPACSNTLRDPLTLAAYLSAR